MCICLHLWYICNWNINGLDPNLEWIMIKNIYFNRNEGHIICLFDVNNNIFLSVIIYEIFVVKICMTLTIKSDQDQTYKCKSMGINMQIERKYCISYLMAIVTFPCVTNYEIYLSKCAIVTLIFRLGHGQIQICQSKKEYSILIYLCQSKKNIVFSFWWWC